MNEFIILGIFLWVLQEVALLSGKYDWALYDKDNVDTPWEFTMLNIAYFIISIWIVVVALVTREAISLVTLSGLLMFGKVIGVIGLIILTKVILYKSFIKRRKK